MAGDDAQVRVGADASAAVRAARAVKEAWANTASEMKSIVGGAALDVASSLSRVVTANGQVNFESQRNQVKDFEAATARMAVASGQDLSTLRAQTEALGVAIGKRPIEVAQWSTEVGRLTYSFEGAQRSQRAFAGLAAETGRSVEDYKGLAAEIGLVGRGAVDATAFVGGLTAQAKMLGEGATGGVAALSDQFEALHDVVSRLGGPLKSRQEDLLKVSGLAAVLGKGLSTEAAARVQQQTIGAIVSQPMEWGRYLGRKITDEHGQIPAKDIPKILEEITGKVKRTYGKDAERVLSMPGMFGPEGGAALAHADFAEVRRAGLVKPSTEPQDKLAEQQRTDAGKRAADEAELAKKSREFLGSQTFLGKAADWVQHVTAEHPIAATLTTGVVTGVAGKFAQNLIQKTAMQRTEEALAKSAAKKAATAAAQAAAEGAGAAAEGAQLSLFGEAAQTTAAAGQTAGGLASKIAPAFFLAQLPFAASDSPSTEKNLAQMKTGKRAVQHLGGLFTTYEDEPEPAAAGKSNMLTAAEVIAKAVADAIKGLKLEVTNASDTPIAAGVKAGHSAAAGGQQHSG